jgi:hypothetical protein
MDREKIIEKLEKITASMNFYWMRWHEQPHYGEWYWPLREIIKELEEGE